MLERFPSFFIWIALTLFFFLVLKKGVFLELVELLRGFLYE